MFPVVDGGSNHFHSLQQACHRHAQTLNEPEHKKTESESQTTENGNQVYTYCQFHCLDTIYE